MIRHTFVSQIMIHYLRLFSLTLSLARDSEKVFILLIFMAIRINVKIISIDILSAYSNVEINCL